MKKIMLFLFICITGCSIGYSYTINLPKERDFPKVKGVHCICFPKFIDKGNCYLYYDYSPYLISIPAGEFIKCEVK